MSYETDRSRILANQSCPRLRYWSYEHNGKGIQPVKKSLPLVFGAAFHEGTEMLLDPITWDVPTPEGVDRVETETAVRFAKSFLEDAFKASAVDLEEPQTVYNMAEQAAIAEGLIRGWAAHRLPQFMETFEVLEVEQEGRATLCEAPELVLMFRPDALVRDRISGDLYVISWKTSSMFAKFVEEKCARDMQSMSEVWGWTNDQEQGNWKEQMGRSNETAVPSTEESPARIEGTIYLFAVKGQRRLDEWDGIRKQSTPLAYAWLKEGPTPEENEWSWAFDYATEEINERTGKPKHTKLGKGWRKVPVWTHYEGGIKQWIDDLANQRVQPRHLNALEAVFPEMLPVSRRASEIDSWRRQTISQELRVQQQTRAVTQAAQVGPEKFREVLDREFPQHTHSCLAYNSKCSMWDVCWTEAVGADPLASGLYQIRVSNHPEKGDEE